MEKISTGEEVKYFDRDFVMDKLHAYHQLAADLAMGANHARVINAQHSEGIIEGMDILEWEKWQADNPISDETRLAELDTRCLDAQNIFAEELGISDATEVPYLLATYDALATAEREGRDGILPTSSYSFYALKLGAQILANLTGETVKIYFKEYGGMSGVISPEDFEGNL